MRSHQRSRAGLAGDELLDALDETGVLEDPGDRIGYVLRDEGEAVAMAKVGLRLNYAQQDPTDDGWRSVAEAARAALDAIDGSKPRGER